MPSKSAFFAGAAIFFLAFGGQASHALAAITYAAKAFEPAIGQQGGLLIPAGGHGAGGGAIFWPTGTPYGLIYSYRGKHPFYHRVKSH